MPTSFAFNLKLFISQPIDEAIWLLVDVSAISSPFFIVIRAFKVWGLVLEVWDTINIDLRFCFLQDKLNS